LDTWLFKVFEALFKDFKYSYLNFHKDYYLKFLNTVTGWHLAWKRKSWSFYLSLQFSIVVVRTVLNLKSWSFTKIHYPWSNITGRTLLVLFLYSCCTAFMLIGGSSYQCCFISAILNHQFPLYHMEEWNSTNTPPTLLYSNQEWNCSKICSNTSTISILLLLTPTQTR